MGVEEIIAEYDNQKEPRLEEIREWFEDKPYKVDVSTIQRFFGMGYRQATRAFRQLNGLQCNTQIENAVINRTRCSCPCHTNENITHFMACCNNGFIETKKHIDEQIK